MQWLTPGSSRFATAGRCKSTTQPDGGEGLAKRKGEITLAARAGPERSAEQRREPMNNSPDKRPTVTGERANDCEAHIHQVHWW